MPARRLVMYLVLEPILLPLGRKQEKPAASRSEVKKEKKEEETKREMERKDTRRNDREGDVMDARTHTHSLIHIH